jgi:hypothetical protein
MEESERVGLRCDREEHMVFVLENEERVYKCIRW